jgi:hypothetical protein
MKSLKAAAKAEQGGGGSGASLLKSLITRKGKYRELNQLAAQFRELQVKEESQAILLQLKDEKLREIEEKLVGLLGDDIDPEEHANQLLESEEVNRQLRNQAASVQSANEELKLEVVKLKQDLKDLGDNEAVFDREQQATRAQLEEMNEEIAARTQEAAEHKERLRQQDGELDAAKASLSEYTGLMAEKTDLLGQVSGLEGKLQAEQEKSAALSAQLLRNGKIASTQQNDLQNRLQSTRQFLEELKLEYEEFSSVKKLELDQSKVHAEKQYTRLKREHDDFKHRSSEEMLQAHREQEDVVRALQNHFHEYRGVVETLFYTEAGTLERKVEEQTMRYEQEIKFIIKAKDQHFNQMITSKDAKIMNLIEGTDLQKVLIKHQLDIEHLKLHHAKDLEMVKELALAEQQKLVYSLKKEIQEKDNEIDKLMNQVLQWDKKLASTLALNTKLRKQQKMQNEANQKIIKETQEQLNKTYQRVEELLQVKENLRHKILRMRLKLEGKSDETLDSLIKRLSRELSTLRKEWEVLGLRHHAKIDQCHRLEVSLKESNLLRGKVEKELEGRTSEYAKLTDAFESYLNGRLKRIRGPRMAARDGKAAQLMNSMSGPMVEAWYGRNPTQQQALAQQQQQLAAKRDSGEPAVDEGDNTDEEHKDRLALLNQVIRPVYNMRNMHQDQKTSMGGAPADFDTMAREQQQQQTVHLDGNDAPTQVHTGLTSIFARTSDGKQTTRTHTSSLSRSSSSSSPSSAKYAKAPPRARIPRRLRMMSRARELVDVQSIQQLDAGYQLVKKFKEKSTHYTMNLRGHTKMTAADTLAIAELSISPFSPSAARSRRGPGRDDMSSTFPSSKGQSQRLLDEATLRVQQAPDGMHPPNKEIYPYSLKTPTKAAASKVQGNKLGASKTPIELANMLEDTVNIRVDARLQQQQQQQQQNS